MALIEITIQTLPGSNPTMDSALGEWGILPSDTADIALTLIATNDKKQGEIFFHQSNAGGRKLTINGVSQLVDPAPGHPTMIRWGFDGIDYHFRPNYYGSGSAWFTNNGGTLPPPPANQAPTVTLAADNTTPKEGTNVLLTATPADVDGTISKVEFYEDTTLLGTVTSAPWTWPVNFITAGAHSYMARAYDDQNAMGQSSSIIVSTVAIIPAPTNLTATANSSNTIDLAWQDNSTGEDNFILERSVNGGAWSTYATLAANTTTYNDAAVTLTDKYAYRVKAVKGTESSAYSNIANAGIIYAYYFDGTGDNVTFPNHTAYNVLDWNKPWSIEVWYMQPDNTGNAKVLFAKHDSSLSRGIILQTTPSNNLQLYIRNNGTNQINLLSQTDSLRSAVPVANKWYHVIVTYNGSGAASGVKFMWNGNQYTVTSPLSASITATCVNTAPIAIGSNSQSSIFGKHYQALTRVYNYALSQSDIDLLYNKGVPNYTPGLTGCIFEMKVQNDVFNTGTGKFTVNDSSATANNGTSAGLTASQKIVVNELDAFKDMFFQGFSGGSLSYDTYLNAGEDDTTILTQSPFTDRMRTNILYDAAANKTWVAWMQRGYLGFDRKPMVMYVDHISKIASPSYPTVCTSPGTIDGHPAPSICLTADNELLLVNEDIHRAPLYIQKTTGKDPSVWNRVATLPGAQSYPTLQRVGSRIYCYFRGYPSQSNDDLMSDGIRWSDDNGVTWTDLKVIFDLWNNTGVDRAYFCPVYDKTKLRYFIHMREDSISRFTRIYYIESSDGVTWSNIDGSYSKVINTSSDYITRDGMDANFLVKYDSDNSLHIKAAVLTPSGPVCWANDSVNNYQFLSWNGSAWVSKPVNIPLYSIPASAGNGAYDAYWVTYSYNDNHFVWWRVEVRSSFAVVVQYETTDRFNTWTAGTIVSPSNIRHEQINGTFNWSDAQKMIITANQVIGTQNNKMFIYEWTP